MSGMCGRFVVDDTVWSEVERLVGWLDRSLLGSGDVFPTQQVLMLRRRSGGMPENIRQKGQQESSRQCIGKGDGSDTGNSAGTGAAMPNLAAVMAHWGYTGYGTGREIINARAETVREKPSFRADFAQRRCVIPARGFYEWNPKKEKFYFSGSAPVLYLAGVYSNDPGKERVTILTTQANASMRPVHDRMPLLIPIEEIEKWMEEEDWAAHFLKESPPELKREKEDTGYEQLSLF